MSDPLGPRFRTLTQIPAPPVPDVDPGALLRRLAVAVDWRQEARAWYDEFHRRVDEHVREAYAAEQRRFWAQLIKEIEDARHA